jgi:hypothetical protein
MVRGQPTALAVEEGTPFAGGQVVARRCQCVVSVPKRMAGTAESTLRVVDDGTQSSPRRQTVLRPLSRILLVVAASVGVSQNLAPSR